MSATGPVRTLTEDSIRPTNLSGSPVANARAALDGVLAKMEEASSIRIRLQVPVAGRQREIVVESVKPDRLHVSSPDSEFIMIGHKFYVKGRDGWQVMSTPASVDQSDSGSYFSTFVRNLLLAKSNLQITGQILGEQVIDGVDTMPMISRSLMVSNPGKSRCVWARLMVTCGACSSLEAEWESRSGLRTSTNRSR